MVLADGGCSQPESCSIRRVFRAPTAGSAFLAATILASSSSEILFGVWNGFRLRSQRSSSARYRAIHLSPVGRLMPNSRHRALLLFSRAKARMTNSSLDCSTVFLSHGISLSSLRFDAFIVLKTVNHVLNLFVNYLTGLNTAVARLSEICRGRRAAKGRPYGNCGMNSPKNDGNSMRSARHDVGIVPYKHAPSCRA